MTTPTPIPKTTKSPKPKTPAPAVPAAPVPDPGKKVETGSLPDGTPFTIITN